jgi:hypothetical protein
VCGIGSISDLVKRRVVELEEETEHLQELISSD